MAEFRVREFRSQDYPSLAQVHDSNFPDHPFFRKRAECEDFCYGRTRYRMRRLVAETGSGTIVGFGEYKHLFFQYHPRKFALDIEVLPRWRGKGVGRMLHESLLEELAGMGAETVWPLVLSTQESAVLFLQARGYIAKRKIFESRLDLRSFVDTEFVRLSKELERKGLEVSNLSSEFLKDPSAGKKVKELEDSGAKDVPGEIDESPMSYHDYEMVILKSPIMVWEGSFVAKQNGIYVGESSLLESGVAGTIDQGFTIVRPEFRGKNIAQVVKLQTASYARSKGLRYIRTHNDSENRPMLGVNMKMGFKKMAEWILFEKQL